MCTDIPPPEEVAVPPHYDREGWERSWLPLPELSLQFGGLLHGETEGRGGFIAAGQWVEPLCPLACGGYASFLACAYRYFWAPGFFSSKSGIYLQGTNHHARLQALKPLANLPPSFHLCLMFVLYEMSKMFLCS